MIPYGRRWLDTLKFVTFIGMEGALRCKRRPDHLQRQGDTPGRVISPVLANIFLHLVLDEWFVQEVKPRLRGHCFMVRFADDFVIGFQHEDDAIADT